MKNEGHNLKRNWIKSLFTILALILSTILLKAQLPGEYYSDACEFLDFESDSIVNFNLAIDMGSPVRFYKNGMGQWKIVEGFLFITILPQPCKSKVEIVNEHKDSIRIYANDGQALPFVNCTYFNKQKELIGGCTTDREGWASIPSKDIDSVHISFFEFDELGFNTEAGQGYEVILGGQGRIHEGQIVFYPEYNKEGDLLLKEINFTTKPIPQTRAEFLKLKVQRLLTGSSQKFSKSDRP